MRKPSSDPPAAFKAAWAATAWTEPTGARGKIAVTCTPAVESILAQTAQRSGRGRADICREILSMAKFGSTTQSDPSCIYFRVFLGAAEHTFTVRATWDKNGEPKLALMRWDES